MKLNQLRKSNLLPAAILGKNNDLSDLAKKQVQSLIGAKPMLFAWQIFCAWFIIFSLVISSASINHVYMDIFAVIIIATRINILALLIHDQAHFLGFRSRIGDLLANVFTAFPIGTTIGNYAQVHLSHHKHYFSDKDPDHLRKSGVDWMFPMSKRHILKLILRDVTGLTFISLCKGKSLKNSNAFARRKPIPKLARPLFYTVLTLVLTLTGSWSLLLLFWVVPFVTVFPLIVRLGAITEHVYNLQGASVNDSSPLIILRWWEKLLLPNLNFTFHSYHHFYPGISFSNLPKVHAIYQKENLICEENIFHGYFSYLKYLQKRSTVEDISLDVAGHSKQYQAVQLEKL